MGSIEKIHEMLVSKECSCTELTKSYLDDSGERLQLRIAKVKRLHKPWTSSTSMKRCPLLGKKSWLIL